MPNEVKLLPCPFCGNAPVLDDFNTSYRPNSPPSWRVMCKGPCAVELFTEGDGTREAAIAAWNHRPTTVVTDEVVEPIPMMLFCPKCGLQHIDAPDERTPDWTNPPHKSHLCHGCGTIWRPADVPTEGVAAIQSRGSKDTIFYNHAAIAAMPTVVTGEQPQDLGDHALPCSASSPVSRSRPKAAAAIARKGA